MSCCCGDNPNEACGYPPKTIRATISIIICVIAFIVFAFMACWFTVKGEYTNAMGIAGMMVGELGTVIGYYFGSKGKDPSRSTEAGGAGYAAVENNLGDVPLVVQGGGQTGMGIP